jgi:hypothetical protein
VLADLFDRALYISLTIIIIVASLGLVLVAAVLAMLGVGNLFNGGHYISIGPALILVGMSVVALAVAFFLGWFVFRRLL